MAVVEGQSVHGTHSGPGAAAAAAAAAASGGFTSTAWSTGVLGFYCRLNWILVYIHILSIHVCNDKPARGQDSGKQNNTTESDRYSARAHPHYVSV